MADRSVMACSKVVPVRTCLSQSPHPTYVFHWDSVPNPDAPRGLCVLHVFAAANTRTRPVVWWRLVNPATRPAALSVRKEKRPRGFLLLGMTTSIRHYWRLLPDTIVSERHDQREKPNNLKLIQPTKVLNHNQLVDKAKARLPTFSHNLHLVGHHIFLALNNIQQITTYRLFDSIQLCVCLIPSNAPRLEPVYVL